MTRAILLPINMVAINLEGFFVNRDSTFARKSSCFFAISIWILLAEIKAISIPEKKAEKNKEAIIMTMVISTIYPDYRVDAVRIFFCNFFERETFLLTRRQKRRRDRRCSDRYSNLYKCDKKKRRLSPNKGTRYILKS